MIYHMLVNLLLCLIAEAYDIMSGLPGDGVLATRRATTMVRALPYDNKGTTMKLTYHFQQFKMMPL